MSVYKRMFTAADNTYVDINAVSDQIYSSERDRHNIPTPANPVPEQIPTQFDKRAFITNNQNILHQGILSIGSSPKSGYKSLRWYGSGPY